MGFRLSSLRIYKRINKWDLSLQRVVYLGSPSSTEIQSGTSFFSAILIALVAGERKSDI